PPVPLSLLFPVFRPFSGFFRSFSSPPSWLVPPPLFFFGLFSRRFLPLAVPCPSPLFPVGCRPVFFFPFVFNVPLLPPDLLPGYHPKSGFSLHLRLVCGRTLWVCVWVCVRAVGVWVLFSFSLVRSFPFFSLLRLLFFLASVSAFLFLFLFSSFS